MLNNYEKKNKLQMKMVGAQVALSFGEDFIVIKIIIISVPNQAKTR